MNDWLFAIASRFQDAAGFGGACLGVRAEAVVDKRVARPSLVKEGMEGDYLLANA